VLDAGAVVLWAGYMHKVRSDPDLMAVHEASYLAYRDALQRLIETLPRVTRRARPGPRPSPATR
jgi:TetR/AcrR family transcriptional repressor of bet genes